MVIGWSNSNDFSGDNNVDTHSVTRLAFPGTSNGKPDKGNGRHNTFINAISASRLKLTLTPNDMMTEFNPAKYVLTGHWQESVQLGKKKK